MIKDLILNGLNLETKTEENINVSFRGKDSPIWLITPKKTSKTVSANNTSRYIEDDYRNAVVKVINPKLKSIFDRTGVVLNIIPNVDYIEVDIDFGRGIGVQRLTESDIEIVIK